MTRASWTRISGFAVAAPLALLLAACGPDAPTAPDAAPTTVDAPELNAKKGNGAKKPEPAFEPSRFAQLAAYAAAPDGESPLGAGPVFRVCQVNPYEDADGNDFVVVAADGRKEHVNEKDAVIAVTQGTDFGGQRVTHIGRATWEGEIWLDKPDPPGGAFTFANTRARGVVFPVDRSDPATQELIAWFNEAGDPGSIPDLDLRGEPLGPDGAGSDSRALVRIGELLADAEASGELLGVECHAHFWDSGFIVQNEIVFGKNWPGNLNKLF